MSKINTSTYWEFLQMLSHRGFSRYLMVIAMLSRLHVVAISGEDKWMETLKRRKKSKNNSSKSSQRIFSYFSCNNQKSEIIRFLEIANIKGISMKFQI